MGGLIGLTGATGYIGGRLLHALESRGERVRCLSRRPEYLQARVGPGSEVVRGDVTRPRTLRPALEGVETAYYLVHSMGSAGSFVEADRKAAAAFARAARAAGVRRLIYLGGLGEGDLSEHLASRQEVGRILRESGVPTIEFRASIVIGSGSASFEMLRALVERLPVMVTPRWVNTPTQPIAIEDVIAYLLAALDYEPDGGEVFEIGGADVCSYLDLMHEYADQRGLRRQMVPVPVLTPRLSSLWLHLVTPVYAGIGRELVDSLRNETVVNDPRALEVFPVRPRTSAEAVAARSRTRTTRSRRPAGRTRRLLRARATAALATARGLSTHAASRSLGLPRRRSRLSSGSAVTPAGTSATTCGSSAAPSTHSWADPVFGADAATRSASRSATRSTSGASRGSSRTGCYGSPQR